MKTANDKKIIDIHAHAFSLDREKTGCFLSKKLMNSLSFRVIRRFFGIGFTDSTDEIEKKVNKKTFSLLDTLTSIDYVVLLAFDGIYDKNGYLDEKNTHFYIANDYVRDLTVKHEKALYGASVNPNRHDSIDELERVIKDGAVLIKWLPNTHRIATDDERYTDFYKTLAKNNMPLLVHTGNEYALHSIDRSYGDFKRLEPALKKGVTVIAAHCGGLAFECRPSDFDTLLRFLKEYDNFYMDTAAMFLLNKRRFLYRFADIKEIHHKIVFGSDWPVPSNPLLFLKNTSPAQVLKMTLSIKNPVERNLAFIKNLNFGDEILYTGYNIIKKDRNFESI